MLLGKEADVGVCIAASKFEGDDGEVEVPDTDVIGRRELRLRLIYAEKDEALRAFQQLSNGDWQEISGPASLASLYYSRLRSAAGLSWDNTWSVTALRVPSDEEWEAWRALDGMSVEEWRVRCQTFADTLAIA